MSWYEEYAGNTIEQQIQKNRKIKLGRPVGTTRAAGYKVSPGRPTGMLKGWKKFERNIVGGFGKLLHP